MSNEHDSNNERQSLPKVDELKDLPEKADCRLPPIRKTPPPLNIPTRYVTEQESNEIQTLSDSSRQQNFLQPTRLPPLLDVGEDPGNRLGVIRTGSRIPTLQLPSIPEWVPQHDVQRQNHEVSRNPLSPPNLPRFHSWDSRGNEENSVLYESAYQANRFHTSAPRLPSIQSWDRRDQEGTAGSLHEPLQSRLPVASSSAGNMPNIAGSSFEQGSLYGLQRDGVKRRGFGDPLAVVGPLYNSSQTGGLPKTKDAQEEEDTTEITPVQKKRRVFKGTGNLASGSENVGSNSTVWDDWERVIDLYRMGGAATSHLVYKDLKLEEKRSLDLSTKARSRLETIGDTALKLGVERFYEVVGYCTTDRSKKKRPIEDVITRCHCVTILLKAGSLFPESYAESSALIDQEILKRRIQVSRTETGRQPLGFSDH